MKTDNKWVRIGIGIIALLVIYFVFKYINGNPIPIKSALVVRGPLEQVVSASGVVDAPVYELSAKMGGRILDLKVKEGAWVEKGALLATFDNYDQARNDFSRAKQLFNDGAASQQALDAAKTNLDSARIIAPQAGVVAKINYDEGETVVPGSSAVVVVNYDKSWVEAQIDEIDIAGVKIGDKVKVTSDVYPDKNFESEIYWIAPLAELRKVGGRVKGDEESYVFPCKIKFLGKHDELKVNMSVNVEIVTKKTDSAVIVPREALMSKDDTFSVFAVKGGRVYQSNIQVGIRSYSSVEVVSGLKEGDIVATTNILKLKDKARISIEK